VADLYLDASSQGAKNESVVILDREFWKNRLSVLLKRTFPTEAALNQRIAGETPIVTRPLGGRDL
jgi:hypothetical protein